MQRIQQSIPIAARRRIYFTAVLTTNLQTRITGLSANWGIRWLKAGVANAAGAGAAPTEVDSVNMPGVYYYEPTAGEIDTIGPGVLRVSNTTGNMEPREIPFHVDLAYFGTVAAGTLTTSSFTSNLTQSVADYWKDSLVLFHTGALAGQVKKVGSYTVSGGLITLASGYTFSAAPSAGDIFELIDR